MLHHLWSRLRFSFTPRRAEPRPPPAAIAGQHFLLGRSFPADRINPKNTALVRTQKQCVGEFMSKLTADRARLADR